jgi:hypothetical protein
MFMKTKIHRDPVALLYKNHTFHKLPDRVRKKSLKTYDDVCILVTERWRQVAEWEPTIEYPDWVDARDANTRTDNMLALGNCLKLLDDVLKEEDYLYVSIFQSDVKTLCKGLRFLHSKSYLTSWKAFEKSISRFGSYDKVFLLVTQLYEEYLRFCSEILQRKPIFKAVQNEYPDFMALLNAAVWCVKYEIDSSVYVEVMYEAFSALDKKMGGGELYFSCKHVGSTTSVRPPVKAFKAKDKDVRPWKEIMDFLGLDDNVRIECSVGIPLGFKMSDRHLNNGGSMKDIVQIQDEFYWADGTRYQSKFQFCDNTAFTIFVTPFTFKEFKDRWFQENPKIPEYEELKVNGRGNLSQERYESIKKLYERML